MRVLQPGSFVTGFLITCYEGSSTWFICDRRQILKGNGTGDASWLVMYKYFHLLVSLACSSHDCANHSFSASIPRSSGMIFYFVMKKRKKGDKKKWHVTYFMFFGTDSDIVHVTDIQTASHDMEALIVLLVRISNFDL